MTTPGMPAIGLGQFVADSRFMVPSHQRDYSWDKTAVSEFLRDIEEARDKGRNIYFCGLMVFTRTGTPELRVLDGQQRLATTLMIFSAMRNWLESSDQLKELSIHIRDHFLGKCDIGETLLRPKLVLTAANNDLFQKHVIGPSSPSEISEALKACDDRNKKLLKAALYVNEQIASKADDLKSIDLTEAYFRGLTKYIANEVKIVCFLLDRDEAAYTIFETLNDRGMALAPLDLVKNYLFSRANQFRDGGLRDLEERWSDMMTLLGPRADSFLRAFWVSRHGAMQGSQLFTAFKKAYAKDEQAYQISVDMRSSAERYAALFNSADPIWSEYSDNARQRVDALGILGLTQSYPIVLAALEKKFSKTEMERLLHLLEVIAVRFQLAKGGRPGRVESLGGRAAREIFEGKITKTAQVRAVLNELYIPDDAFKIAFQAKSERNGKKARYLLAGIERQSLQRGRARFPAELIPGNVTLEHIVPRGELTHWADEIAEDPKLVEDMLHRLGNMCLLGKDKVGNLGFTVKCKTYAESRLNVTKGVAEYSKWGRDEIERRQGHMADLAAAHWRFQ